jgi:hypothetical protein
MGEEKSGENPFAVESSQATESLVLPSPTGFVVHGDVVVCGGFLVLPAVCWKSGVTEDLQPVVFRIEQASFTFTVDAHPVQVLGYISQAQKRRELRRILRLLAVFAVGLLLIISGMTGTPAGAGRMLVGGLLILFTVILAVRRGPVVRRFRSPNLHFVHGFSAELLAQMRSF